MGKQTRNKPLTKADFINAVIEDIAEHGFKEGMGARVAENVGRHASRINDLFGGLDGLLKAAIAERDHWDQLFEKFSIPPRAKAWQIKELFIGMMSSNFTSFKANPDMQNFILGQMSVEHEVLREVSARREFEGAKMLAATDAHFEGSGACFNTVSGIMLGASYFYVLHDRFTGGTVAGVNISKPEDMERLKRCMVWLMELAWREGGRLRKRAKKLGAKMGQVAGLVIAGEITVLFEDGIIPIFL